MPFDKLYVKIKCLPCSGTRIFNHGLHDPHEPYKWKRCPYCDPNGHIIIEATPDLIAQFITNTEPSVRKRLLAKLSETEAETTKKETT